MMTPDEVERLRVHVEAVEGRDAQEASLECAVAWQRAEHLPAGRSTPASQVWIVNLPDPYRTEARATMEQWQACNPRPEPFDTPAKIAADLGESLVMLERGNDLKPDAWERTHRKYLDRVLAFHLLVPSVETDIRLHGNSGNARAGLQGVRRWCLAADAAVDGSAAGPPTVADFVERVREGLHSVASSVYDVERLSRRMEASIGYVFSEAAEYERWTTLDDARRRFTMLSERLAEVMRLDWPAEPVVPRAGWDTEPIIDHEDPRRLAERVDDLLSYRKHLLQAVGDLAEAMGWHDKADPWSDAVRGVVAAVYERVKEVAAFGKPGERWIDDTARLTTAWLVRRKEDPTVQEAMERHAETLRQLVAVLEVHCPADVSTRRPPLPWERVDGGASGQIVETLAAPNSDGRTAAPSPGNGEPLENAEASPRDRAWEDGLHEGLRAAGNAIIANPGIEAQAIVDHVAQRSVYKIAAGTFPKYTWMGKLRSKGFKSGRGLKLGNGFYPPGTKAQKTAE